ncbi:MAG TPA: flagellar hook-basal body complex protein FliE [Bryobacteraceae bacterium]|nr:flagellar hook-basal body complex protein FliE [Bryobacteraceae bacterium]
MTPIAPIHVSLPSLPSHSAHASHSPGAFQSVLSDAISKVESFQNNAATSANNFLNGEGEELHKVALAAQQADLSFQLFMQVRNRVVAAYNQVMQMQV